MAGTSQAALGRLVEKITFSEIGCWEWNASLDRQGYGQMRDGKRTRKAHRVAYEVFVGDLSGDLTIDHLCRNRRCVRPEHLEAVPGPVNSSRASKGILRPVRTVCTLGHPLSGDNAYFKPGSPKPLCRICRRVETTRRAKGTGKAGEHNSNHKMTWDAVRKLRDQFLTGVGRRELARTFRISEATVHQIVSGKTWTEFIP